MLCANNNLHTYIDICMPYNAINKRQVSSQSIFAIKSYHISAILAATISIYIGASESFFINQVVNHQILSHLTQSIYKLLWIVTILSSLYILLVTLYFFGYFRFETPRSSEGTYSPRLWLYECTHYQNNYLCFPP